MKRVNDYTSVRYVAIRRDNAGSPVVIEGTAIIPEIDPCKVRKELVKRVGDVTIISTKKISLTHNKFFTMADLAIIDDALTTVIIIPDT